MQTPKRIIDISINSIVEPDTNPNSMEHAHYELLVNAIRSRGFLQPLLVREPKSGEVDPASEAVARLGGDAPFYRLVDGAHRLRAAREVGLTTLPCVVLEGDVDDATAAALQIGMNRLRGDLNLADVAKTIASLADQGWTKPELTLTGMTLEEIDDLLKATRPTIEDVLQEADLGTGSADAAEEEPAEGSFPLEIVFMSAADRRRAQKALKKAAGRGQPLGVGLLRLLDDATE